MASNGCEINLKDGTSSKNNLRRNNYFKGKLLSAEDFIAEQNYLTDKIRRLSAQTNGYGVIDGLRIEGISNKRHITLRAGSAIDTSGNLYLLHQEKTFDLSHDIQKGDYIYLKYLENGVELLGVQNSEECSDECCYNKIEELFEVVLSDTLLVAGTSDICGYKYFRDAKYKKPPLQPTKTESSIVLIGQYNDKGGFDYSKVDVLHKNSELSKLICKIFRKYVTSVNGDTGDVSAVASLNNATPDTDGHINFVAGNNITITSEGHNVTFASSNGFYHDYYLTLAPGSSITIDHNARRFPLVDVYKREINPQSAYYAIKDTELKQQARDTMKPFEALKEELHAELLEDFVSNIQTENTTTNMMETVNRDTRFGMEANAPKMTYSANYLRTSKKKTSDELIYSFGITTMSPQVIKLSDLELAKVVDIIYVIPNYQYTKVLGTQENEINIEVRHLHVNSVKFTNKSTKEISLLVILST